MDRAMSDHMRQDRLQRESDSHSILLLENGREVYRSEKEVYARYGVEGIIRIRDDEYAGIDPKLGYLGHFNLETAGNVIGSKNALPRIVRSGHYDVTTKEELLPLLSFDDIYYAVCEQCEERLSYDELTEEHFRYPLGNVRNAEDLKRVILARYRKSLHGVSDSEILARGVAFTLLRLID